MSAPASAEPCAVLTLWDQRFLYATRTHRSNLSSRASATLLFSATDRPLVIGLPGGDELRCHAAWVPGGAPRALLADGCGLLSLNIDPSSADHRVLARHFRGCGLTPLSRPATGRWRERAEAALADGLEPDAASELCDDLMRAAGVPVVSRPPIDRRVEAALSLIASGEDDAPLSLPALARRTGLSPDRLRHLFQHELGLTVRGYRLWTKIRRAAQSLHSGRGLTEIAADSGFADAAHMSRTFVGSFGLGPSFLNDASRVRVRVEERYGAHFTD